MALPEPIKQVSFTEWVKFCFYVLVLAGGAGMWYQNKQAEGESLSARITAQGDLFSDRINALSARMTGFETVQSTVVSDIASTKVLINDVRNELRVVGKDVSFLAQKIQERGELRDRQLASLQSGQTQINQNFSEKLEEVVAELAEHRVLLERAGISNNYQPQRKR